jgi:hypothetical protein
MAHLLAIAMAAGGGEIPRRATGIPRAGARIEMRGDMMRAMRLFYVIVTALLLISLGLLEIVAARGVMVGP